LTQQADELEIVIQSEDMAPFVRKDETSFKQTPIFSPENPYSASFRATFVMNAMRRDSSPPLSSYFQGTLNRALLQSLPMRRPSNSPAKSKAQLCALLYEFQKMVDQNGLALRTPRRLAAIAVSVLAVIRFFLRQTKIFLLKSVVFLEIAIVIFAMLVLCLCTRVLAAPTLKLAKNRCLTPFGISSSGNTRGGGGIALVLTALAAMQWTAPKSACAASPQSAPIKTLDSARQNRAQASAGGRNSSEPPPPLDPILAEARSLADKGMASEAERRVRQYLTVHPDSANAHFLLGHILFREIQAEARLESQLALQVQASMGGARVLGANSSDTENRDEKAKASLAEFTAGANYRVPTAADLKVVAFDYVLLGDYFDADKWLTKMLEWAPNDSDGWYHLGRTKYSENRFAEAISAFQQCLKLDLKNVKAEDNLGLSFAGLGRNDEASAAYQQAIAWQAQSTAKNPGPYIDMGSLLIDENRPQDALTFLLQATEIAPREARAHELLGKAYTRLEQFPKAESDLEKAIELSPQNANLHCMLAPVYRKQGFAEKAKIEFDRCAAMTGSHSTPETPRP
jgi:Flp pilus assembly protein TadD